MPSNRRRAARAICQLDAKVLGPRGSVRGVLRNLSAGGLFFQGKDLLPVGASGEVEFVVDGVTVRATSEVRYHHRFAEGTAMGMRFLRLEPAALAAIQAFVDKSPQTPDPRPEG